MKKIKLINILNIFLSIAFIVALGARFYYSDRVATAGQGLGEIESQISYLQKENQHLQNQYLSATSLSVIKPLALENGYVDANVEYYTAPGLALR